MFCSQTTRTTIHHYLQIFYCWRSSFTRCAYVHEIGKSVHFLCDFGSCDSRLTTPRAADEAASFAAASAGSVAQLHCQRAERTSTAAR